MQGERKNERCGDCGRHITGAMTWLLGGWLCLVCAQVQAAWLVKAGRWPDPEPAAYRPQGK